MSRLLFLVLISNVCRRLLLVAGCCYCFSLANIVILLTLKAKAGLRGLDRGPRDLVPRRLFAM